MGGTILTLTIILWVVAVFWLVLLVLAPRELSRLTTLDAIRSELGVEPDASSLVSILVPARNEEKRVLVESITSLLEQDYPRLEVIAIDDCSTDGTLRILRRLAGGEPRMRVIEGAEPPPDWLGKVHALHQAAETARGEWVLAVDSDVILHREALRTLIDFAKRRDFDVVALAPDPDWLGFWPKIILPAAALPSLLALRFSRVNDPTSDQAYAGGAFTLLRREALEEIGGFTVIKDQLPEGAHLMLRLKKQGYRVYFDWIPGLMRTPAFANLAELWRSHALAAFPGLHYRTSLALGVIILALLLCVLPAAVVLIAILSPAIGWAPRSPILLPALVGYFAMVIAYTKVYKLYKVSWVSAFLVFVGHALLVAILLTSMWAYLTGRGVKWRGRQVSVRQAAN